VKSPEQRKKEKGACGNKRERDPAVLDKKRYPHGMAGRGRRRKGRGCEDSQQKEKKEKGKKKGGGRVD